MKKPLTSLPSSVATDENAIAPEAPDGVSRGNRLSPQVRQRHANGDAEKVRFNDVAWRTRRLTKEVNQVERHPVPDAS